MPGRMPCARKSSIAPPPVETKENCGRRPMPSIAAIVSPPPITEYASDAATARANASVAATKPFS